MKPLGEGRAAGAPRDLDPDAPAPVPAARSRGPSAAGTASVAQVARWQGPAKSRAGSRPLRAGWVFLVLLAAAHAHAEGPRVDVRVDPAKVRIGDTVVLTATVEAPAGTSVETGDDVRPDRKLGSFRVASVETSDRSVRVSLVPEETGELEIPAFEIKIRGAGGAASSVPVAARKVAVESVLGEGDASLSDIKPPAELPVPWPWRSIAVGLAAAALLGALLVAIVRRLRRPRRPAPVPESFLAPGVTADQWARAELDRLLARRLVESGRSREFHIELADLARRYLELRFRVPALERTTGEIGEEMRRAMLDGELAALTTRLLEACDRVKFAKYAPGTGEIEETLERTRELIARSAPVPPAAASAIVPGGEGPEPVRSAS